MRLQYAFFPALQAAMALPSIVPAPHTNSRATQVVNAAAVAVAESPTLNLAGPENMDWTTESITSDVGEHIPSGIFRLESASASDSIVVRAGSDTLEDDPEILILDEYLPACLADSEGAEVQCLFYGRLPFVPDDFPGSENTPSIYHDPMRYCSLGSDAEWQEFRETSARADVLAAATAAAILQVPASARLLGDFNAVVDAAAAQSDASDPPAPAELYNGQSAASSFAQNTIVEEQQFAGTVGEIPQDCEYEDGNRERDGVHGGRSGPELVLDPVVLDDLVDEILCQPEDAPQSRLHNNVKARQNLPLLRSPLKKRRLPRLSERARQLTSRAGSRSCSSSIFVQPTGLELQLRKQRMIAVQKDKVVECDGCPRRFKKLAGMLKHKTKGECSNFICGIDFCTYDYPDSRTVIRHRNAHLKTGDAKIDKPSVCNACSRRFPRGDHLLRHISTAHGPGPTSVPVRDDLQRTLLCEALKTADCGGVRQLQTVDATSLSDEISLTDQMLIDMIMEEDFGIDKHQRDKKSADHVNQAPNSRSPCRLGVPQILDIPVQPIDDLQDLGYRLDSDTPAPAWLLNGGLLSGSAGPSQRVPHSNSACFQDPSSGQARSHRQSYPPFPEVPPRAGQRDRGFGTRPRAWGVPPIWPNPSEDEIVPDDDQDDAEFEFDDEEDLCGP